MSRKAAHLHPSVEAEREKLWALIRKQKSFTALGLQVQSSLGRKGIRSYLDGLLNAGYLELDNDTRFYTLVNDPGVDAPRVKADGSPVNTGQSQRQMWNALTVLRDFSAKDLAFNASTDIWPVTEKEAQSFIRYLHLAGYLVQKQEKTKHREARYMMIAGKWHGPKPPQIQKIKQVYDPNTRKVVWMETDEGGAP